MSEPAIVDDLPDLKPHQLAALRSLADDPAALTESGTLGFLRRKGLVGRVVGKDDSGRQKTTSPVTDRGRRTLAEASHVR